MQLVAWLFLWSETSILQLFSKLSPDVSWFQTFATFRLLYSLFWVIHQRLNFMCRRFETLCLFRLHRSFKQETTCKYGTDREFRNVDTENSYAGESSKRKNTSPGAVDDSCFLVFIAILRNFGENSWLILQVSRFSVTGDSGSKILPKAAILWPVYTVSFPTRLTLRNCMALRLFKISWLMK
jgi:hypothetical protein